MLRHILGACGDTSRSGYFQRGLTIPAIIRQHPIGVPRCTGNGKDTAGRPETLRGIERVGACCTYGLNAASKIPDFIPVPLASRLIRSLPPISERLAASPKTQLWPEVTEGPKVFPKLGAG